MADFLTLQTSTSNPTLLTVLYTVLLAFVLSTAIGITYVRTFRGLSYSRNFVQALILGAIVAATVMQAIGDSLAHGLGMLGALAIIRFRTSFKDSRDILFMFASLAAGISCGVGGYTIGVVGSVCFIITAAALSISSLGGSSRYDGLLRGTIEKNDLNGSIEKVLNRNCALFALVTLREMQQGKRFDFAYQVKLKKDKNKALLMSELPEMVPSLQGLSLMLQESTIEL